MQSMIKWEKVSERTETSIAKTKQTNIKNRNIRKPHGAKNSHPYFQSQMYKCRRKTQQPHEFVKKCTKSRQNWSETNQKQKLTKIDEKSLPVLKTIFFGSTQDNTAKSSKWTSAGGCDGGGGGGSGDSAQFIRIYFFFIRCVVSLCEKGEKTRLKRKRKRKAKRAHRHNSDVDNINSSHKMTNTLDFFLLLFYAFI